MPGPSKQNPEAPLDRTLCSIAAALHDDVLQAFATCLLKAQYCERLADLGRYDQLKAELPLLEASLNGAVDSVRDIIVKLKQSMHGEIP